MQTFLLPYIVKGFPVSRTFVRATAPDIQTAAVNACKEIMETLLKQTGQRHMVAVAEVDYAAQEANTARRNNVQANGQKIYGYKPRRNRRPVY